MKVYFKILWNFIKKYYIPIILLVAYGLITNYFHVCNCPIKLMIGFPCPGCGMTRACLSILRLDFVSAFRYNPFVFVLPFIMWIIIFNERPIISKLYNSKILWISLLIVVIITYILRLIFIYPNVPMDYYVNNLFNIIVRFFKGQLFN